MERATETTGPTNALKGFRLQDRPSTEQTVKPPGRLRPPRFYLSGLGVRRIRETIGKNVVEREASPLAGEAMAALFTPRCAMFAAIGKAAVYVVMLSQQTLETQPSARPPATTNRIRRIVAPGRGNSKLYQW